MERDGSKLYLPALFHEALGKEYSVFSDKRGRSHNLARLAIATYIKGDIVTHNIMDKKTFRYQPTWGEDLAVEVITNRTTRLGPVLLSEVKLEGTDSSPLVVRYEPEFTVPTLHIEGGTLARPELFTLDIDEGMDRARQVVVEQTQSIIDRTI